MYEWRMNGVLYVVLYVYNEYLGKCVHGKGGRGANKKFVCLSCLSVLYV